MLRVKAIRVASTNNKLDILKYIGSLHCKDFKLNSVHNSFAINEILFKCFVRNQNIEVLDYLLEIGANINALSQQILCYLVKNNNHKLVKYAISKGASLAGYYTISNKLLFEATKKNDIKMVELLVTCGLELFSSDNSYVHAYVNKYYNILKYLLALEPKYPMGFDLNNREREHVNFLKFVYCFQLTNGKQWIPMSKIYELYERNEFELLFEIFKNKKACDIHLVQNNELRYLVVKKYNRLLFNKIYECEYEKDILFIFN